MCSVKRRIPAAEKTVGRNPAAAGIAAVVAAGRLKMEGITPRNGFKPLRGILMGLSAMSVPAFVAFAVMMAAAAVTFAVFVMVSANGIRIVT